MFPLIIKNRKNSESPESTLHKLYEVKSSININQELKTLDTNPYCFNRNNKIIIENQNSKHTHRNFCKKHFNNYKTENTDYNHHFSNNILNLSEEDFTNTQIKNKQTIDQSNENKFINFNDAIQKMKFLDYLKSNPLFTCNNKFNKETILQTNVFTSANFNKNYNTVEKTNNEINPTNRFHTIDSEKNINNNKLNYKGPYISNLSQYSIKDSFLINNIKLKNNKKNFTKDFLLRGKSHVYSKDIINKNLPSLYYEEYNRNLESNGFRKEKNSFEEYLKNAINGCVLRDSGSRKNNISRLKRLQSNPSNLKYENKVMTSESQNCIFRKKFPKKKLIHLY